jgi:hypothetical protein
MIAGSFGVLLGTKGFAYMMTSLLFLPPDSVAAFKLEVHPIPYVRIFLLGALLRALGHAELDGVAGEIEETWRALYDEFVDPKVPPFLDDCARVADALLHSPLDALEGYSLRDFVPDTTIEEDLQSIAGLAAHLLGDAPPPDAQYFPIRLVPATAQAAAHGVSDGHTERYEEIHQRAVAFSQAARAFLPSFLAGDAFTEEHEAYLRGLVQDFDFGAMLDES